MYVKLMYPGITNSEVENSYHKRNTKWEAPALKEVLNSAKLFGSVAKYDHG